MFLANAKPPLNRERRTAAYAGIIAHERAISQVGIVMWYNSCVTGVWEIASFDHAAFERQRIVVGEHDGDG